jgi:hypothetical protein
MRRVRFLLLAGLVLVVVALVGLRLLADGLEREIEARIVAEAKALGAVARVARVRVSPWGSLQLTGVQVDREAVWSARVEDVSARLLPWGGAGFGPFARIGVGNATLAFPAGLELRLHPTAWAWDLRSSAELVEPAEGLSLRRADLPDGRRVGLRANRLDLARLAQIRIEQAPLRPGPVDGELQWERRASRGIEARFRLRAIGADVTGQAALSRSPGEGRLELTLEADRLDFARLFTALGLEPPFGADALGSLRAVVGAAGSPDDPASFEVTQRLEFTPPPRLPDALLRLRGDFVHEVSGPEGEPLVIQVSPASPHFVAGADVPPLFVKALLLAEDSAFFSHPGLDLRELPMALAVNWGRGGAVRGASTITQQLAKNLFLSREKSLKRKLQELVIAFLLEAALGKDRILEIYLNVIEWGPGLYGLRPAANHYFGKQPSALSAKEICFLVVLIPGPVKHQRSFIEGALSPGLEPLVTNLLAKLRAAEALSEEEYAAALAETLAFRRPEEPTLP